AHRRVGQGAAGSVSLYVSLRAVLYRHRRVQHEQQLVLGQRCAGIRRCWRDIPYARLPRRPDPGRIRAGSAGRRKLSPRAVAVTWRPDSILPEADQPGLHDRLHRAHSPAAFLRAAGFPAQAPRPGPRSADCRRYIGGQRMNATVLDLDAYVERVQYGGRTDPTFDTLVGILRAHMHAIPFENLDVLLGRQVRLDLDGVQGKLVRGHRGGYCFEHATLFAAVLERLGFHPLRHTARVVLFSPRTESPRAHMLLTVSLSEGRFVVDPGFGALAPGFPVLLGGDFGAHGGPPTHRMVHDAGLWVLQVRTEDKIVDCWVTTLDQ